MNCLNCGAPLVNIAGYKEKKFCNDKCKVAHWQKENKRWRSITRRLEAEKVVLVLCEDGLWETIEGRKCKLLWEDEIQPAEKLKPKIVFQSKLPKAFDGLELKNITHDEAGQFQQPVSKSEALKNFKKKKK